METLMSSLILVLMFFPGASTIVSRGKNKVMLHESVLTSQSATYSSQPALLAIPGELRNKIYRLVLLKEGQIEVTAGTSHEPPLLSACRQIHAEATGIHYKENTWSVEVRDWDHTVYKAFFHHIYIRRGISDFDQMKTFYSCEGEWRNKQALLRLLRFLHEDEYLRPFIYQYENSVDGAITGAFAIIDRMKTRPWEEIEQVLEVYLREIARDNGCWEWMCDCEK